MRVEDLVHEDPAEAARHLADAAHLVGAHDWLAQVATAIDELHPRDALTRVLTVWGLSNAEAGRLFGVSRQAIGKWRERGVPTDRAGAIADLAAATDLLDHYLKRDRIPAVVRRAAPALGGESMLDLVASGRTGELLEATRSMFDLRRLDADAG